MVIVIVTARYMVMTMVLVMVIIMVIEMVIIQGTI